MRQRICCWLPAGLLEAVQTRLASEVLADVTVPAHLQGPLPPEKERRRRRRTACTIARSREEETGGKKLEFKMPVRAGRCGVREESGQCAAHNLKCARDAGDHACTEEEN